MRGEKRQELGRPSWFLGCEPQVGPAERGAEDHEGVRSAHSTLRRESRAHGEGADRNTQPAQETLPEQEGSDPQCQPPCREEPRRQPVKRDIGDRQPSRPQPTCGKRVFLKSPVRENRAPWRMARHDWRALSRLPAGQPRHPAAGGRRGVRGLLHAQPHALSAH